MLFWILIIYGTFALANLAFCILSMYHHAKSPFTRPLGYTDLNVTLGLTIIGPIGTIIIIVSCIITLFNDSIDI